MNKITNHDQYSQLTVIRIVRNSKDEVLRLKKFIYLSTIISYEDGQSIDIDTEEGTIYIVSEHECYYIIGNIDEFDKVMTDYINSMRKILNSDYKS